MLLLPFAGVHPVSVLQEGLQPHPRVRGFSQWGLALEQFLVVLPVRESKVRTDLCCHLGVISVMVNFKCQLGECFWMKLTFKWVNTA